MRASTRGYGLRLVRAGARARAKAGECFVQAFSRGSPFPYAGAFCCARELKTLVARSREQFFMTYRTSGEAVLWERVMFSALATKQLVARAQDFS